MAVGSNIEPAANVFNALRLMHSRMQIGGISTVFQTEALGNFGQKYFYNCVIEVWTDLDPRELKLRVLRSIESELGRKRGTDRYADRTIDLDLVLYDQLVINHEQLVLPDPEIFKRYFIAAPLAELAPDLILPGSNTPIKEVAAGLSPSGCQALSAYTEQLRILIGV